MNNNDPVWKYFSKVIVDKKTVIVISSIMFIRGISLALGLVPIYFITIIFDQLLPSMDIRSIVSMVGLVLLVTFISSMIEYVHAKVQIAFYRILINKTRSFFVNSLLNKNVQMMNQISSGDIIYRGNTDFSKINSLLVQLIMETPMNIIYFFVVAIWMFKVNILLATIALLLTTVQTFYNSYVSKKYYKLQMTQKSLDADTLNYLKRILDRFLFIKLNRLAYIEKENYLNGINKNIVATNKLTMFQTVVSIISSYIGNLSQMSILIAGAFFIHNETLTLGVFISFTNLIQKLNEPINYLNSIPFMWKDLLSSYSRVIPLLTNESFNIERIEEIKQPNIIIQCRNVSLSYENRKILKDFNYSIKEKQNMAIIGKSGIGKSSFCKMLAGILEYDGEIIINKNKDNNVPLFGFIIDQCSLFDGTLGENLLYGKENNNITFEEISEILKYLEIDYFTAGLETNLWVNKLSHGEKQRLEIARILIQKPQIIILDEATSGMDNMTENKVWNLIRDRCKNSTIIYITHNLSIIREEDIVLDFNSLPDVIINEGNTDKILTNVV